MTDKTFPEDDILVALLRLAYVVLPNGQTAGEWMGPQIQASYDSGTMPDFMPELGTGS